MYTCYLDGTVKSLKSGSLYIEYTYDADRNLTSLKTVLGGEVLADKRYSYDHNGNRTERQQPGGATRYAYDSVNQLTKIEYPTYMEQLYYDKAGNRSRRITDGTQEEYRYDPANHLTEYTTGRRKWRPLTAISRLTIMTQKDCAVGSRKTEDWCSSSSVDRKW